MVTVMTSKFNLSALDSRCERTLRGGLPKRPSYAFRGSDNPLPSLMTSDAFVAKPVVKEYTGTAMLGVATLHKSNAVLVFQEQDAVEISRMRRG